MAVENILRSRRKKRENCVCVHKRGEKVSPPQFLPYPRPRVLALCSFSRSTIVKKSFIHAGFLGNKNKRSSYRKIPGMMLSYEAYVRRPIPSCFHSEILRSGHLKRALSTKSSDHKQNLGSWVKAGAASDLQKFFLSSWRGHWFLWAPGPGYGLGAAAAGLTNVCWESDWPPLARSFAQPLCVWCFFVSSKME